MIFSKPKSANLSSRIADIDNEIAAGAAAITDLKAKWRATILNSDDAARAVVEDAITVAERKATMQAERRGILVAEHQATIEREAKEEFDRRRSLQEEANRKAAAGAQKALRKAWETLAPALRELANARTATDLLNKAAPKGVAPLAQADDIARGGVALPRVNVTEKVVEQWVYKLTGDRVGDQDAVQGNMVFPGLGTTPQICELRKFRRVEYHPAQAPRYTPPIATELCFPRWDCGGLLIEGPRLIPEAVVPALDQAEAIINEKPARPTYEEFIPVDDPALRHPGNSARPSRIRAVDLAR